MSTCIDTVSQLQPPAMGLFLSHNIARASVEGLRHGSGEEESRAKMEGKQTAACSTHPAGIGVWGWKRSARFIGQCRRDVLSILANAMELGAGRTCMWWKADPGYRQGKSRYWDGISRREYFADKGNATTSGTCHTDALNDLCLA